MERIARVVMEADEIFDAYVGGEPAAAPDVLSVIRA
jgi:hypothetical protein